LGLLAAVGALALAASPARADGGGDLPATVEVKVLKVAEVELGRIERALKAQPGIDANAANNVTLALQGVIEDQLGQGPVTLYPRAVFALGLRALSARTAPAAIAQMLADYQSKGKYAQVEDPVAAPTKRVASFVFDRERVGGTDPHLPDSVRARPGDKLKGSYLICVGVDGKVQKVSTVQSIPGADHAIIDHIKSGWVYNPQPVPVCTNRTFVFQIN
jgi:hypothetical protein